VKTNAETIMQIERLYSEYEKEVMEAKKDGYLMDNTVKTYLLHTSNFVKWCKGNFEPGGMNKRKY
jgi:phage tail sheath gpL-like